MLRLASEALEATHDDREVLFESLLISARQELPGASGRLQGDVHEEWIAAERRYFSEGSMAKLVPERDDGAASTGELEPAR